MLWCVDGGVWAWLGGVLLWLAAVGVVSLWGYGMCVGVVNYCALMSVYGHAQV